MGSMQEMTQTTWEMYNAYNPDLLASIQQVVHGMPVEVAVQGLLVENDDHEGNDAYPNHRRQPRRPKSSGPRFTGLIQRAKNIKDAAKEHVKTHYFPRSTAAWREVAKEYE